MDKDYQNFVERMGSFEEVLDLSDDSNYKKPIVTRNRSALAHHGVKGMKWGHHNISPNTAAKAVKTGQDLTSLGQTVTKTGSNKKYTKESKHMSDEDLKRITNRLNLENNYVNARTQQSGRSKVEGVLSIAGSTLAVASSAAALYSTIRKAKV